MRDRFSTFSASGSRGGRRFSRPTSLLYHRVLRDGERLLSRDLAATTTREGRALSRRRLADGGFGW